MRKCKSIILIIVMLLSCALSATSPVHASTKNSISRTIGIVFDNSGSMYTKSGVPIKAWCQATYAMEVFASMLNEGDKLLIYPMHPIVVNGKEYTMQSPLKIEDASKASVIRDIYTKSPGGTPIESIDSAVEGLQKENADKKYLIVLTDGDKFYKNNKEMNVSKTKQELDARFQKYAGPNLTMMYLGIGANVAMPQTAQSEYFVKKQATNSSDVISVLTEMCNLVFGRDTLPKNRISGNTVKFDISMNKLIVFVQGQDLSNLKVTGPSGEVGTLESTLVTKYGTAGAGGKDYEGKCISDTSLQGMVVTYTDCDAGTYTIEYDGTATSIEVYYEPNAELEFEFTDSSGNKIDPQSLYEGEYMVKFGLKDGKTGKLIDSELLGKTYYQGSYFVNGEEQQFTSEDKQGEVMMALKMGDTFRAKLTVTYLSGYVISKDSSDFGWPETGISILPRPAGDLKVEITGGDKTYRLDQLEASGEYYTVKVYYKGTQLTGDALKSVDLQWNADKSNARIESEFAGDHYKLKLCYKNPDYPKDTKTGKCTVFVYAYYTEAGSSQAEGQAPLSYNIRNNLPLNMELIASQDYIVISEMEKSQAMVIKLNLNGDPLTEQELAALKFSVDCGGMNYELIPNATDSSYLLKLKSTDGVKDGDYNIKVKVSYTDSTGRTSEANDKTVVTMSTLPLWLKWLIGILLFILLVIIILLILHIRVLPKYAHVNKKESKFTYGGNDVMKTSDIKAGISGGQFLLYASRAGSKVGIQMEVKPGKESYLRKPQVKRTAEGASNSVRKVGMATIQNVMIGSAKYALDPTDGKLHRTPKSEKPILLRNGLPITYSGTIMDGGVPRPFNISTKLDFRKSKK